MYGYGLNSLREDSFERKGRKRVGRGRGSKLGKTSGRGHKGRGARSGASSKLGHEGGRKPLYLTLPIKGRTKRKSNVGIGEINIVTLFTSSIVENEVINIELLKDNKMMHRKYKSFKLLGNSTEDMNKGNIKKIVARRASKQAAKILEDNGIELEIS